MRSSLRNFLLAATILGCTALVSGGAGATPTLVGTTTNPTGINGLVVDGTIYDVTFNITTLNSFTAGTTLSIDAATALADALNSLSVTELNNTSATFYLLDVDNSLSGYDSALMCSNGQACPGNVGNWHEASSESSPNLGLSGTPISFTDEYVEAADFTEVGTVGVPEPLTLSLFGAGLVGAAAMRRRKKVAA